MPMDLVPDDGFRNGPSQIQIIWVSKPHKPRKVHTPKIKETKTEAVHFLKEKVQPLLSHCCDPDGT